MKKDMNLEKMLDYIAIEEAPTDLIYKWKVNVELQKEKKNFYLLLLRPSVVFPIVLVGFWYYFAVFKKDLFEYYLVDGFRSLFQYINPIFASSTYSIASSNYYIIGAIIFSVLLATISLFWFYQGKKHSYAPISH